jgi:hypothetical protein
VNSQKIEKMCDSKNTTTIITTRTASVSKILGFVYSSSSNNNSTNMTSVLPCVSSTLLLVVLLYRCVLPPY